MIKDICNYIKDESGVCLWDTVRLFFLFFFFFFWCE
jgi:hypothetical protein